MSALSPGNRDWKEEGEEEEGSEEISSPGTRTGGVVDEGGGGREERVSEEGQALLRCIRKFLKLCASLPESDSFVVLLISGPRHVLRVT